METSTVPAPKTMAKVGCQAGVESRQAAEPEEDHVGANSFSICPTTDCPPRVPCLLDVTLVPPGIWGSPGDPGPRGPVAPAWLRCRVPDSNGCLTGWFLAPQQPEPAALSPSAQD